MSSLSSNNPLSTDELRQDAANWLRLQELYHLLEATPAEQHTAILNAQTDDPALRARVLSLLATSAEPDKPASAAYLPITAGSHVGPYAIVRHLGSGGLGSVYLIERLIGGAIQPCALKLLATRANDASFHARFEREQQILATLQHPNITHLLDAGISDIGQPYLVMEYVDGQDLTRYCDERRLPLRQRLEIFLSICEAVIYAHSQLVVHLDLKPSNVLITSSGNVKLLDFGTSKLIDVESTQTTTMLATPAYASPEQLRGEPVTTSCDLYSLGVILYELLTGHRPFENASAVRALQRAATEEEPAALHTTIRVDAAENRGLSVVRLRRLLEGDLSSIAGRCLRSRPRDRYGSVEALVDDVRRFLDRRPVLARPQTATYRVGKFIRRNRTLVTVSAAAMMAIASSSAYAVIREHQAIRDAQRAVQMQTFLYHLLYVANANYMGKPSFSVPQFLNLGARLAPDYVTNPADLRRAQLGLAESMFENDDLDGAAKLFAIVIDSARSAADMDSEGEAEATGGYIAYEKGNIPQAEAMTAHALELSHRRDATPEARVWSAVYFAMVRDENGSRTDANLQLVQRAVRDATAAPLPQREIADVYYNLALAYQFRARFSESEAAYRQALNVYGKDPEAQCDRADIRRGLARDEDGLGNFAASLTQYEQAWDESKRCSGERSQSSLTAATYVAESLLRLTRSSEALRIMQGTLPAMKALGMDGSRLLRPTRLLGEAYVDQGDFAAAEVLLRQYASHVGSDTERQMNTESGLVELVWAQAELGLERRTEALNHARKALSLLKVEQLEPSQKIAVKKAAALVETLSR